jgi:hypothetical protein
MPAERPSFTGRLKGTRRTTQIGLVVLCLVLVALGILGVVSASGPGGTAAGSDAEPTRPQTQAEAEQAFVSNVERQYDYSTATMKNPREMDQWYLDALQANGFDPAFGPTPEMAIVYAKAACNIADRGGDPTQQLAVEFGAAGTQLLPILALVGYYCPEQNLSERFG